MAILYVISVLVLLTALMLYPKSEERQNAVLWLTICLLAYECYVSFIAGLFSLAHIPVDILSMAMVNFASAAVLYFLTRRRKRRQSYTVKIIDVVFACLLVLIVVNIFTARFAQDSAILYATVDPADRLSAALHVLQTKTVIYTYPNMYFGHITNALFMQALTPVFPGILSFRAFEIMELINLWLGGMLFFTALRCYSDRWFSLAAFFILALLYTFGYPWSNELWGFNYLGIAVNLLIFIQIGTHLLLSQKADPVIALTIISMGCFGVGISYTLFVPPAFLAALIAITLYAGKSRAPKGSLAKRPSIGRQWLLPQIGVFAVPVIMTLVFTVFLERENTLPVENQLMLGGAIFRNLFTDFLPYLPFALFCLVLAVKNKDWDFARIFAVIFFLFQLYFFSQMLTDGVSTYYYYKLNYVTWFIVFFLSGLAIDELTRDKKNIVYLLCYFVCWAFVGVTALAGYDAKLGEKKPGANPVTGAFVSFQIYENNRMYFENASANVVNYSWDFVELCRQAADFKDDIYFAGDAERLFWQNDVEVITARAEDSFWADALVREHITQDPVGFDGLPVSAATIWIVLKDSRIYESNKETIDAYDRVFENDLGFIVLR